MHDINVLQRLTMSAKHVKYEINKINDKSIKAFYV